MRISDWSSDVCASDLADGEFGVAVREEAVSGGGQSPQLRRAADRPGLRLVSHQTFAGEVVEVLAHRHGGDPEAAGEAGGILRAVLLQDVDEAAAAALFRRNGVAGAHEKFEIGREQV